MDDQQSEYRAACYCGAVAVTARGAPAASAFCHCRSCRRWHAAPVNAWSIWPTDAVTIAGGAVVTSHTGDASRRIACAACGGGVANHKPKIGMTVLYPTTFAAPGFGYAPTSHIFYAERVINIADGLPKFADMPTAFGGSGERIEEPDRSGWRG